LSGTSLVRNQRPSRLGERGDWRGANRSARSAGHGSSDGKRRLWLGSRPGLLSPPTARQVLGDPERIASLIHGLGAPTPALTPACRQARDRHAVGSQAGGNGLGVREARDRWRWPPARAAHEKRGVAHRLAPAKFLENTLLLDDVTREKLEHARADGRPAGWQRGQSVVDRPTLAGAALVRAGRGAEAPADPLQRIDDPAEEGGDGGGGTARRPPGGPPALSAGTETAARGLGAAPAEAVGHEGRPGQRSAVVARATGRGFVGTVESHRRAPGAPQRPHAVGKQAQGVRPSGVAI
jgi:hypothetical protein